MSDWTANFVLPHLSEEECRRAERLNPALDWPCFADGISAWTLQTFLELRSVGTTVSLSNQFRHDTINVAHAISLNAYLQKRPEFIISLQADYPRSIGVQQHIVQNKSQVLGENVCWMPHWPQPGLLPRDKRRKEVRNVGYAGRQYYNVFRGEFINQRLKSMGLRLVELSPANWNDFSQIDVLCGVRSTDGYSYDKKPPSKMINSWLANVPFIGGPDSAYKQIGHPGINYLLAENTDEIFSGLRSLVDNPHRYQSLVTEGCLAGKLYCRESIRNQWIAYFSRIYMEEFVRWKKNGLRQNIHFLACDIYRKVRRTVKHLPGNKFVKSRLPFGR